MFKVLVEGCQPTKGTKYSACVDLYASEDVVIVAGETKLVGLGVAIDEGNLFKYMFGITKEQATIELHKQKQGFGDNDGLCYEELFVSWASFLNEHYLQLMLRSSLGKKGLILPNGIGIIDLDYKDEIKIIIHNPIVTITRDLDILGCCEDNEMDADLNWEYRIKKGDKIAQIMLCEHKSYLFGIETGTERNGGFGSTGA